MTKDPKINVKFVHIHSYSTAFLLHQIKDELDDMRFNGRDQLIMQQCFSSGIKCKIYPLRFFIIFLLISIQ